MWYVYILYSESKKIYYKGLTNNLDRRVKQHNNKECVSTKHGVPWRLIHYEQCNSRLEARKREEYYKSGAGREELKKFT